LREDTYDETKLPVVHFEIKHFVPTTSRSDSECIRSISYAGLNSTVRNTHVRVLDQGGAVSLCALTQKAEE
jgi:hypothetical protein